MRFVSFLLLVSLAGCLPVPNGVKRMRDSVNKPSGAPSPHDRRAEAVTDAAPDVVRAHLAAVWPGVPIGSLDTWSGQPLAAEVTPSAQGSRIRLAYYVQSYEESGADTLHARLLALSDTLRQPPVSAGFGVIPTLGDPACLYEPGLNAPLPTEPDTLDMAPALLPSQEEAYAELGKRLRYPEMAKRAGLEGRVLVHFVVDTTGTPTCITVPVGLGGGLDEEAVAAVRSLRFSPGLKDGEPTKAEFVAPITFRLR